MINERSAALDHAVHPIFLIVIEINDSHPFIRTIPVQTLLISMIFVGEPGKHGHFFPKVTKKLFCRVCEMKSPNGGSIASTCGFPQ